MEQQKLSLKRGRPTKYTKETSKRVISYIKRCQEKEEFPTIEHLASYLGQKLGCYMSGRGNKQLR
jgi:electron transfer flavoprotein alpha subunit